MIKHLTRYLASVLLFASSHSLVLADDIDLYSANSLNSGVPNVLFVLDNAANFSASAANCTYTDGTAPSLNGTAGGIEQCALYNVISALPAGALNIGLMAYNATNIRDINNANCGGTNGGCLMVPLTLMQGTEKTKFLNWVKSWKDSGGAGDGYVKANGEATGAAMQEAWAYYAGRTGLSGRSYAGVAPPAGCQKNFVIFIGNAFNNSGTPGDTGSTSTSGALTSAPGVTAAQLTSISIPSGSYGTNAFSCGNYSMGNHNDPSGLYADEWARYMYQTDIYGSLQENQGITTYTIGLLGAACKPDYPALLTSMAKVGGGKYYGTSSYNEIADAILSILNEVQAVNSVFSSASLPVSVNAQGTYLNQIFLGMFRPDAAANPRWLGNLKQYQFILEYPDPSKPDPNTAKLVLGDANGNPAISSAGTGFVSSNAVSFWTSKNLSAEPDSLGGFFKNDDPLRGAGGAFDSPDGELVDKGGAAQVLRKANLNSTFAGAQDTSNNPRRLYTYCPSGVSCVSELTDVSNSFVTTNTGIAAYAFGSGTSIRITSIVRSGTTATVTTSGAHGLSAGTTVQISNVTQNEYNGSWSIATVPTTTTFTINGLPDYPNNPSQAAYTIASVGTGSQSITTVTRTSSGSGNTETATVTTTDPHGFSGGTSVAISGVSQLGYNGTFSLLTGAGNTLTYTVTVNPPATAVNGYQAAVSSSTYPPLSVTMSNPSQGVIVGTTTQPHRFHVGQTISISGISPNSVASSYESAALVITSIISSTQFQISGLGSGVKNKANGVGTVGVSTTGQPVTLTRAGTTDTTTATVSGAPSGWFGKNVGDTKYITISKTSGSATNESAYVKSDVLATCTTANCTTLTYPITTSPSTSATGGTVALPGASSIVVAAGGITRTGDIARVGANAGTFTNGQTVLVSASGSPNANETAYTGTWSITCAGACSSGFTFGPVTLTPSTTATGSSMQVYAASTPPDSSTLIKWVRGQDNFGDEKGPGGTVTVRPSVHGDVLHSRPVVINYGKDSSGVDRGIVVYYGANDGVFRAVNGNQTTNIGSVPPGGELWGLVLPEHFGLLNRQRLNSPELRMPTTQLTSAQSKDYFVDGSPGFYQKLKADGTIDKAYIYLTMRRGGRFIYALDVSDPSAPKYMWKIDASDVYGELGQTWSRPRVTLVSGYSNPVLVFGAGYDSAEDSEPPVASVMGRGIYVLDAITGKLVWRVTYDNTAPCTGTNMATGGACLVELGMKFSIPSDISFVDRNNDGKIDRFYVPDLGGNLWRVDLEPAAGTAPSNWQVTKLADVGCGTSQSTVTCSDGNARRKFFYPPNVVSVGATGASGSYDVVLIGSGDREHPLKLTDSSGAVLPGSSFAVTNRFYAFKDTVTGKDAWPNKASGAAAPAAIVESSLYNASSVNSTTNYSTQASGAYSGFYITLPDTGEKSVNASVTVRGTTYFGTNTPTPPSADSCRANLGKAKGYSINPFTGTKDVNIFDGGGLPPSPTTGVVLLTVDGKPIKKEFCVGCGGGDGGGDNNNDEACNSALENCSPGKAVPKSLKRTYWFKK